CGSWMVRDSEGIFSLLSDCQTNKENQWVRSGPCGFSSLLGGSRCDAEQEFSCALDLVSNNEGKANLWTLTQLPLSLWGSSPRRRTPKATETFGFLFLNCKPLFLSLSSDKENLKGRLFVDRF